MRLAHALDGPDGAPVLVLPSSLGTTLELWEPQLAALTGGFRALRYDQRGHGGSPAPPGPYAVDDLAEDALELLDELGLERVSWCGLSLGGVVGMQLVVTAPERVDRLVLACTSARFDRPEAFAERASVVRRKGMEAIADTVVARWLAPGASSETVAWLRAMLVTIPPEGYAGCCEALSTWDFRDRLAEIDVPTLVIAGAEDEATPLRHAELLANAIPGATLKVLDGAGHLATVDRADAFAGAVLSHLETARAT
jgi:3-oxoadipate enol-lactonase